MRHRRIATTAALVLALALASCDRDPTGSDVKFIQCGTNDPVAQSATIGPGGGVLFVDGHSLVLPPGAVRESVSFTATILADQYLKVRIQANGNESWQFDAPAVLTLSFDQCDLPGSPDRLRIYKIDPQKNTVISDLGGGRVTGAESVTVLLDSLSTYTLGMPD